MTLNVHSITSPTLHHKGPRRPRTLVVTLLTTPQLILTKVPENPDPQWSLCSLKCGTHRGRPLLKKSIARTSFKPRTDAFPGNQALPQESHLKGVYLSGCLPDPQYLRATLAPSPRLYHQSSAFLVTKANAFRMHHHTSLDTRYTI